MNAPLKVMLTFNFNAQSERTFPKKVIISASSVSEAMSKCEKVARKLGLKDNEIQDCVGEYTEESKAFLASIPSPSMFYTETKDRFQFWDGDNDCSDPNAVPF